MLSEMDETFLHQAVVTFDQAAYSDHRFFDRMALFGHCADGTRLFTGMGAYKNTNTFDGFFGILRGDKQYNLRLSRPFLPDSNVQGVGPLSVEVIRPLQELRVEVRKSDEHPIEADIRFTGTTEAREEAHHLKRIDGRLVNDFLRFDQVGRLNGWMKLNGERINIDDWFAGRDHSWGMRYNMGGYQPVTNLANADPGRLMGSSQSGLLLIWMVVETESYVGHIQLQEDGDGKVIYEDGHILKKKEGRDVKIVKIAHDVSFVAGTRTPVGGLITLTLADGDEVVIEFKALLPPYCDKGAGYDSGYNDEAGLGVHRGNLLEFDVYDLSHPEEVQLPDGRTIKPWQRETVSTLTINGEPGLGHTPVMSTGHIKRYGLEGAQTNRRG